MDDCRRPEERVRPCGRPRWPSALVSARAVQPAKQGVHLGRLSGRVSEWVSGRRFGSVHPTACRVWKGQENSMSGRWRYERALAIGEAAPGPRPPDRGRLSAATLRSCPGSQGRTSRGSITASRDIPAFWQCKRFIPCAVRRAGYAPEQGGEQPIDQGAIDQPINLIEPVAQDRGPGRDGARTRPGPQTEGRPLALVGRRPL